MTGMVHDNDTNNYGPEGLAYSMAWKEQLRMERISVFVNRYPVDVLCVAWHFQIKLFPHGRSICSLDFGSPRSVFETTTREALLKVQQCVWQGREWRRSRDVVLVFNAVICFPNPFSPIPPTTNDWLPAARHVILSATACVSDLRSSSCRATTTVLHGPNTHGMP